MLAADSAASLQMPGGPPPAPANVLKVYYNADKVMQLRDYPVGILTYGLSSFGPRSVASLIGEFEHSLEPVGIDPMRPAVNVKVGELAARLHAFLQERFKGAFPKPEGVDDAGMLATGVVVAGYSSKEFFPEMIGFGLPGVPPSELRPDVKPGAPDFGASWFGLTDAIVRLHFGRDDGLPGILARCGVDQAKIDEVMRIFSAELQYPVAFHAMPLKDAVDYATYLVSTVTNRFRFSLGAPLCGGPIDVATITWKRGFEWVRKKSVLDGPAGVENV